jgi:hypothetical protein
VRKLRRVNPYRFVERANDEDPRFGTFTQQRIIDDVYANFSVDERFLKTKSLNTHWVTVHRETHFPYPCDILEGAIFGCLYLSIKVNSPDLVRQFCCTIYFCEDDYNTMTWMSCRHKITSTLDTFASALGVEPVGMCIHDDDSWMKGNLSFCYPPRTTASDIGFISSMYLVYPHLSYLLKYNLCNKGMCQLFVGT